MSEEFISEEIMSEEPVTAEAMSQPSGSKAVASVRCTALRSKSSYGAFGDFHDELVELMGATTTYWCVKTMAKAGPDDHYVHRSICQQGRLCWENEEVIS